MNFEGISSVFFTLHKSILNAICGVPEHFDILMFVFDVWFCCYLSWPDIFWRSSFAFKNSFWLLFVVAGPLQVLKIFVEKSILNAICRGRRYFNNFIGCLGSSFLMLFVVAGHGLFFLVFLQKIILNAICRGRRYFWKAQLEVESVIVGILLWF